MTRPTEAELMHEMLSHDERPTVFAWLTKVTVRSVPEMCLDVDGLEAVASDTRGAVAGFKSGRGPGPSLWAVFPLHNGGAGSASLLEAKEMRSYRLKKKGTLMHPGDVILNGDGFDDYSLKPKGPFWRGGMLGLDPYQIIPLSVGPRGGEKTYKWSLKFVNEWYKMGWETFHDVCTGFERAIDALKFGVPEPSVIESHLVTARRTWLAAHKSVDMFKVAPPSWMMLPDIKSSVSFDDLDDDDDVQLNIRIKRSTKEMLTDAAERDGLSLNEYMRRIARQAINRSRQESSSEFEASEGAIALELGARFDLGERPGDELAEWLDSTRAAIEKLLAARGAHGIETNLFPANDNDPFMLGVAPTPTKPPALVFEVSGKGGLGVLASMPRVWVWGETFRLLSYETTTGFGPDYTKLSLKREVSSRPGSWFDSAPSRDLDLMGVEAPIGGSVRAKVIYQDWRFYETPVELELGLTVT